MPRQPRSYVGQGECFPGSDYTDDELDFLRAMDRYKRLRKRPFPTWREVLAVLTESLGYRKVAEPGPLPDLSTWESRSHD